MIATGNHGYFYSLRDAPRPAVQAYEFAEKSGEFDSFLWAGDQWSPRHSQLILPDKLKIAAGFGVERAQWCIDVELGA